MLTWELPLPKIKEEKFAILSGVNTRKIKCLTRLIRGMAAWAADRMISLPSPEGEQ
jgi:hypothetical protein